MDAFFKADLFRNGVAEIKAGLAPPTTACRWCGRWNYHLRTCARSVRLERVRARAVVRLSDDHLRWLYLLEVAHRELAHGGGFIMK